MTFKVTPKSFGSAIAFPQSLKVGWVGLKFNPTH